MVKLNIGRKELTIKLTPKKGRPKKTFLFYCQNFALYLKKIYQDNRFTGNKISRVLRRVFEIKKIKKAIGVKLTVVAFLSGAISQSIPNLDFQLNPESVVYAVSEVKITTERSINRPLDSFYINQGYHLFHKGIDLKEKLGAPVYSIKKGIVKEIISSNIGYGNHIIITHEKNLKSLYAHLGEIKVEREQEVDENTVIGTIGMSGWTTGPHLHFEILENDKAINPLTILK